MIKSYRLEWIFRESSGDLMETMANFFEWINRLLGVSGPGELVMHPVFIGFCVVAFVYTVYTHMKYFSWLLPV